jgi:drug/metabolite transporter (DMT)-like permease
VLTLVALRTTALFVVQALAAASIAAIAAVSAMLFRVRLHPVEWAAVAAVCVGVALLVITQRPSAATNLPPVGPWALLAAAVAIAVIALTATRALAGAAMPGLLAGLAFGDAAVASRVVARLDGSVTELATHPATYAVVISGLIGTLLYATALQRGSVTAVFGLSTVGQTVGPAVTGWLLLGDSVHPGTAPYAGVGFGLAIVGALVLGRHAHPEQVVPSLPLHGHRAAPDPTADALPHRDVSHGHQATPAPTSDPAPDAAAYERRPSTALAYEVDPPPVLDPVSARAVWIARILTVVWAARRMLAMPWRRAA